MTKDVILKVSQGETTFLCEKKQNGYFINFSFKTLLHIVDTLILALVLKASLLCLHGSRIVKNNKLSEAVDDFGLACHETRLS